MELELIEERGIQQKTVVRLTTTSWLSGRQIHFKKTLALQKRKSIGPLALWDVDELSSVGVDESLIVNLYDRPDGLYEIVLNRCRKDWETGYIEDWDYKLVPYTEEGQ